MKLTLIDMGREKLDSIQGVGCIYFLFKVLIAFVFYSSVQGVGCIYFLFKVMIAFIFYSSIQGVGCIYFLFKVLIAFISTQYLDLHSPPSFPPIYQLQWILCIVQCVLWCAVHCILCIKYTQVQILLKSAGFWQIWAVGIWSMYFNVAMCTLYTVQWKLHRPCMYPVSTMHVVWKQNAVCIMQYGICSMEYVVCILQYAVCSQFHQPTCFWKWVGGTNP